MDMQLNYAPDRTTNMLNSRYKQKTNLLIRYYYKTMLDQDISNKQKKISLTR